MRLFLYLDYYITRFHSWKFICFPMKNILFIIRCTFIDLYFKIFFLFYYFFSFAILTFIFFFNFLALSATFITRARSLSIHTRSQHLHCSPHSFTITSIACLDRTSFASSSVTFNTNSFSVYNHF